MSAAQIKSPNYPSVPLKTSISHAKLIEEQYRKSAVDREIAAQLIGYKTLSGPASKTLAALASYGLVERAGKGMLRVTDLAVSIIHAHNDEERAKSTLKAANKPTLFQEIREHFQDLPVPPESGVVNYLNRAEFNPSAVPLAAKAFLETAEFVQSIMAESDEISDTSAARDDGSNDGPSIEIGNYVQCESNGTLQSREPKRVRWVSEDGNFIAVEGGNAALPVSEVEIVKNGPRNTVEKPAQPPIPPSEDLLPPEQTKRLDKAGYRKAVFPVSDGDVIFEFPENLTIDGIEELEAYLEIFLKKEKRNLGRD